MESIKWREHDAGGFIGKLHDSMVHVIGSEFSSTRMTIFADGEQYTIFEPFPLEDAPLGKLIENFKVKVLGKEPSRLEPEIQASILLKKTLAEIVKYAASQCMRRYIDPQWDRKLRDKIWYKMTGEDE